MKIDLKTPRCWKELTEKQLRYVSWLLTSGGLTEKEIHTYAFVRLSGIRVLEKYNRVWKCRYKKWVFFLTDEEIACFSRQLAWITREITEIVPIPKIAGRRHVDARLRLCPLRQYLACENYYQAYIFTKDAKYLDCLLASFYTAGRTFNDGDTARRAKRFRKVPFHVKHAVFLWYYGLKSVLQKEFPNFIQKSERILEDEEPEPPNMRRVVYNMVRALSGGDITKTAMVYEAETWQALAELDAKAREYKEMEHRIKKMK